MMLIRYGYEITLTCPQPTALVCLLSVHDDRLADIRAPETTFTNPEVPVSTYRDLFGNRCRRLVAPAGDLTMWGDATIEDDGLLDVLVPDARELPVQELPDDCLVYLLGSRYCETDRLSQVAWDMFGTHTPGWGRVQAICDFVNGHIHFDYMQARSTRTAFEAFHERVGVCRDFAHLAVTLCRCLNIPARYVNGHLGDIGVPVVDPMDFSAWIEVYLDGEWRTFDPRNNVPRIGRIVVARGRDAADIPLVNSFGPHVLKTFRVWTYEVPPPQNDFAAEPAEAGAGSINGPRSA
jgi:transglutaminase-like putative cysteine protease